jgi:excisionase family DNA binding protein
LLTEYLLYYAGIVCSQNGETMLTVGQAANKLQVTPERVRNMIYAGTIPAEKLSRVWLIPNYAIEQRIAARPKPGRPKKASQTDQISYHFLSSNRALLEECRSFVDEHSAIELALLAETEQEREFYILLWNFFLRLRQTTLIEQGIY